MSLLVNFHLIEICPQKRMLLKILSCGWTILFPADEPGTFCYISPIFAGSTIVDDCMLTAASSATDPTPRKLSKTLNIHSAATVDIRHGYGSCEIIGECP